MIKVACGIIRDNEEKVLITQRSLTMDLPLKWEFPGGKIEAFETPEECLVREIREELALEIEIVGALETTNYSYPSKTISLVPFVCNAVGGKMTLREHMDFKWVHPSDLHNFDWAEADIPVMQNYLLWIKS